MRAPNAKQRAAILGLCSISAAIRGAAYIEAPDTGLISFVDGVIPIWGWVIVWWLASATMAVAIVYRPVTRWAMAFGASLWGTWAVSYTLSWLAEGGRGWVTAGALATICIGMVIAASQMEASRDEPPEVR